MTTAVAQKSPLPGQYFDIPGIQGGTQWTDQFDSTVTLATVMSQTNQVNVNGMTPLQQTDVVCDWEWDFSVTQTYTAGTSTLTTSPYAPWNQIGAVKLPIQGQYNSVDLTSGIDLYIFNMIRPWRNSPLQNANLFAAPLGDFAGSTALGYTQAALAQPNLIVPAQWSTATTAWQNKLRLPASITFDSYVELALTGEPQTSPHPAIVSPQYMAGGTRVITPQLQLNPGSAATLDNAAVNIGAGTGTFAGAWTTSIRRKAVYMGNPAVLPPVYAWQYRWHTTPFSMNGTTKPTFPVPLDAGQILMVYVRMFDPSANGGLGAPIATSALTNCQLQYGSGLLAFNDGPIENQMRFLEQHGFLLPPGVICWDLMIDERGLRTNKRALNTLTTTGIVVKLTFAAATSATAYAVLGVESLVYVA